MYSLLTPLLAALPHLDIIARGGGGGSGGGGGGGGSGGGGGGGGIIALIGYLPTHFVGAFIRRKLRGPVGLLLTSFITIVYVAIWFFIGGYGFIIGIAALVGGPAGYFGWWNSLARVTKKSQQAKLAMQKASQSDGSWNEPQLTAYVKQVFERYQADWSTFNTTSMQTYQTPTFAHYNYLMMLALGQRQRRNSVERPVIISVMPVQVIDNPGSDQDEVVYYIQAKAHDVLIDTSTNQQLFVDDGTFGEFWHFKRTGNNWLFDSIEQETANVLSNKASIQQFAAKNGFYYSVDWGWLLLPQRGVLFSGGKFGTSDINNHVIGISRNVLTELYSYNPKPRDTSGDKYVIAQAALPKRYDSIIVKAKTKRGIFDRTPKGYNKISMEWPDFNKRYDVYATNVEQVTAFELLHPVYMEKLFDLPFKVSIEVVDNVVYLYTSDSKADYARMYDILQRAFDEMKM
jgi:hypothetical protein